MRRSEQRRAAVWALYQADLLGRGLEHVLPPETHRFTRELAALARHRQEQLDELIARHASGWPVERIAPLERAILRVASVELLYPEEVPGDQPMPPEGAIDEAVETAKRFCGKEAPAFVNGILGAILREQRAAKAS
jgi:N utilization substance protein B